MQWTVAMNVIVCLWCITLPTVFWFAVHKHGGLTVEWYIIPASYTIMQFALIYSYAFNTDWNKKSDEIIRKTSTNIIKYENSDDIENTHACDKFIVGKEDQQETKDEHYPSEKTSLLSSSDTK
jgi:hypothetical protein